MEYRKNDKKVKVAFYFDRSSLAKFYAPVAIEFLKRNYEVFFICGPNPHTSWSNNPVYRPLKENIKIPFVNKVEFMYFDDFKEASKLLVEKGISDLFVSHAINEEMEVLFEEIRKKGISVNCIQWAADYLVVTPEKLKTIDNLFIHSEEMKKIYFRHFPEASKEELDLKFKAVGNPIFDCLKEKYSKDFILEKYGIPKGKKIVLLMSMNLTVLPWAKYYFGISNKFKLFINFILKPNLKYLNEYLKFGGYKENLQLIKKWCQKNDAILIVKSRPKHREPEYVKNMADLLISDDSLYPLASVELVSVSDFVIGYGSTVVLEAGFAGVRSLSIDIDIKSKVFWRRTLDAYRESGIFGFKGVSDRVDYDKLSEYLKKHSVKEVVMDQEKRKEYVKKFLGYNDFNSSKRIADYIIEN